MTLSRGYVAGFFDGEGHVGFVRIHGKVYPRVMIGNTNREVLATLQEQFEGDLREARGRESAWKPYWIWRLSYRRAVEFLDWIRPELRVKDAQADLVFVWAGSRDAGIDDMDLLVDQMHWLNRKGQHSELEPVELVLKGVA